MKLTVLFAIAVLTIAAGCQQFPLQNFHVQPRFGPLSQQSQSNHVMGVMRHCAELVRQHAADADADSRNALYVECITTNGAAI